MHKAIIAAATVIGLALSGAAAAQTSAAGSAPTPTQTALAATVHGKTVSVSATVTAPKNLKVSKYGVCATSESGKTVRFATHPSVNLTSKGTTTRAVKTLSPGTYSYSACADANGSKWVGPKKKFVVGKPGKTTQARPTPTTPTPSATRPVVASPSPAPATPAPTATRPTVTGPTTGSTSTPSTAPSTAPTGSPTTPPATTPTSGSSVPVGDLPGWKQQLSEDFNTSASVGSFQKTYADSWCGYEEGTGGKYFNNATISARDGLMDIALNGTTGAAGSFGPASTCWGQLYGRYSIKFKAVGADGNGTAMMLWPTSDVWGDGEIDFPEGNFDSTFQVHHHPMECSDCSSADSLNTGKTFADWHVATTEWSPSGVKYFVDGDLVKTVTSHNPNTPHRWTIQVAPNDSSVKSGHLLIDWVASYTYNK